LEELLILDKNMQFSNLHTMQLTKKFPFIMSFGKFGVEFLFSVEFFWVEFLWVQ